MTASNISATVTSTTVVFQSEWPPHLQPTAYTSVMNGVSYCTAKLSGSSWLHSSLTPYINIPERKEKIDALRQKLLEDPNNQIVRLKTADGVALEGLFSSKEDAKAIVLFGIGAGGCYEACADPEDAAYHFFEFLKHRLPFKVSVLVPNRRGVGRSEGVPSISGCALDYYAAWQFLKSRNLTVLPWGHSLGSYYLIQAAAWVQQQNRKEKVSFISDRSFDDIATEVSQYLGGGVVGTSAKAACIYAGWKKNIQEDWKSLQGEKVILVATKDSSVPFETASLYKCLEASKALTEKDTVIKMEGSEDPHKRIYNDQEMQEICAAISKMNFS